MDFDVLICGGSVIDGSGTRPAFRADVGINGDRIAAIGSLSHCQAGVRLDAEGLTVCPGFIDVHVHSEIALLTGEHRYAGLLQGVTTQFTGADGFGWAPLPPVLGQQYWRYTLFAYAHPQLDVVRASPTAYLDLFTGRTPANVVPQAPHGAIRLAVMGWEGRPADEDEIDRMRCILQAWLAAGAVGLSLGLEYQPGNAATTQELIELGREVAAAGGVISAHVRKNPLGRPVAWQELMTVGRSAGVPIHINHEFVTADIEPLLAKAAEYDLTFDSYVYPAGCTHLALLLPVWAQLGDPAELATRMQDPDFRRRAEADLDRALAERLADGGRAVFVANQTGRYLGEDIADAAAREGRPLAEFAADILVEEDPYALMVMHHGGSAAELEAKMVRTLTHPLMLVSSDGIYHGTLGHPRGYGCFARVLRRFVRELKAIDLVQAIYKMSGFTARRFGLRDRGQLKPGYAADVVVFSETEVADHATWSQPWLPATGIRAVFVNGRPVVENGQPTGELPGRVLKR
ncbi:MAG: amidohydrolase family protein [Firmicutes bacterium]|jgi:N-acyl-D-aspartate/D-glutamate deacylase|nr:amidohydrolase family protein [Bacillota bacterium]